MKKLKIGFLASGGGTNMQAIIDACKEGSLQGEPCAVICNNSKAGAMERARREGIPAYHVSGRTHPGPGGEDGAILAALQENGVEVICLAGYMKKLGEKTLGAYRNRVLNIHPALLPEFGGEGFYGERVHRAVLAAGAKESGPTVHVVDEQYDHGPIVAQLRVPVLPDDTPESLAARVLAQEHVIFTETLQRIAVGEIDLDRLGGEEP